MAAGTTLVAVKTALVTLLRARPALTGASVSAQAPITGADLSTDAGLGDAIWIAETYATAAVVVFNATPLTLDESLQIELVVQSLRPLSDGTQLIADTAAVTMLGEVLGVVSVNPTLGITAFARCEVVGFDWKHVTGLLHSGTGHGSRFELQLHVEARLHLI